MNHLLVPITNLCILVTLSYLALKIRNNLFIQAYEKLTIPLLTGAASVVMMFHPIATHSWVLDLRFAPIMMAGLRFGLPTAVLSTLLPSAYWYWTSESTVLFGIIMGMMVPALCSSLFHRKEYRTGYSSIQVTDGIKTSLLYFLLHITIGSLFVSTIEWEWILLNLMLLLASASAVFILIFMLNGENDNWLMQRRLELLANQDVLTRLPNLRSFMDIANKTIKQKKIAILMIDIDHFKVYNDCLGHPKGDQLLWEVGDLLRNNIGEQDYLARYGGEEFIVMSSSAETIALNRLAQKLCHAVACYPFDHMEVQPFKHISISVGISAAHSINCDLPMVISEADDALYESKRNGRNRFTFYNKADYICKNNA